MLDTILFDLDGTLLSIDTDKFIEKYFLEVAKALDGYLSLEEVMKYFWKSTKAMIENSDNTKTNKEVFFEDFSNHVKNVDQIEEILGEFYQTDFNNLSYLAKNNDISVEIVNILKAKGYNLVVATSPIFPKQAILNRIKWANLNADDFIFITSFEVMHTSKPNPAYYQEILEQIKKDSNQCLMIGNHLQEDINAKYANIKTFLVTDYQMGDKEGLKNVDYKGSFEDLLNFAKQLKPLNS